MVKCGAAHYVCIFIQLSYLSEQIIRGDKLKRWGNNGSCWEAAEWYKHIPEKHQELGKQKLYSTKPRDSKWAAVNDGDDGDDNDDEDAVNKIWMMESFKDANKANFSLVLK